MRLQDNDIFVQSDFNVFGLIHLAGEEEVSTLMWLERFENRSLIENVEFINKYVQDLTKWIKKRTLVLINRGKIIEII